MRHEAPVHWYDWEHGKGFWCITRYDDVVAVLKDWRTFSSETGATALEDLDPDQIEARKSMLDTDPPKHSSLRAIVNKGFTPRAVAAYEDLLRELTRQILDEALPRGEFDFVEEVAKQLPIQVLCRILGVPLSDDERLIEWGDKMIGNTDPDLGGLHPASPESAKYRLYPFRSPSAMEVFNYGHGIAARAAPAAPRRPRLEAGHLGGRGRQPADRARVRHHVPAAGGRRQRDHPPVDRPRHAGADGQPGGDAAAAGRPRADGHRDRRDHALGSPVLHFRRTATADTELHGVRIREGDKVVTWLISANFDEQQFADPLRFDITRKPNNHVTFGRGGPHFCLGAHLAKLETRVMFEELLPRVSAVEPTGPASRMHSNFTNAYKTMPVRVTPA